MKPRSTGGGRGRAKGNDAGKSKGKEKPLKPAVSKGYKKDSGPKDTRPANPWERFESRPAPSSRNRSSFNEGGEDRKPQEKAGGTFKKPLGDKPYRKGGDPTAKGFGKSNDEKPYRKSAGSDKSAGDRPYKKSASGGTFSRTSEDRPYKRDTGSGFKKADSTDKPFRKSSGAGKPSFGKSKPGYAGGKTYGARKSEAPSYRKPSTGAKSRNTDADWDDVDGEVFDWETKPARNPAAKPRRTSTADGIRLNRYIANTGICSRREADDLIKAGAVMVNGSVITEMGFIVSPTDEIRYGGQTLRKERPVYVLLNKPKDYITTTDDPMNRRTVMALVHDACRERIYPVGRLDRETTGLLLLTNDGEITKKLTHPSYNIKKIYHVELDKKIKLGDIQQIAEGIELEDGFIKVDEISTIGADKTQVGVEIHSGRNRIVRRIFEHMGYQVKKLDRVYFAGLTKKDLSRGRWRFLTEMEVNMLRMLTGKKK